MAPTQPTGWPRRELFDERDNYYVPKTYFNLNEISPLNLRQHENYKSFFPNFLPYNQLPDATSLDRNSWGTCTANATASAFVYEWNRQELPAIEPSRLFIYFNARQLAFEKTGASWSDPLSKDPQTQGSLIRLAFKGLNKSGVCSETDWAYDDAHFAKKPDDEFIQKALKNHTLQYSRLDPDQPEGVEDHLTEEEKSTIGAMTLLRLRQCLAEGYPAVFGFRLYWESFPFEQAGPDTWSLPPLPNKTGPTGNWGGHAVLAIGFDDAKQQILCQNSWGSSGEGAPFFWLGYDWIKDFQATSDFWMIRLVEKQQ